MYTQRGHICVYTHICYHIQDLSTHICKMYTIPVYTYITYTYHTEYILYIIHMTCIK